MSFANLPLHIAMHMKLQAMCHGVLTCGATPGEGCVALIGGNLGNCTCSRRCVASNDFEDLGKQNIPPFFVGQYWQAVSLSHVK